MLRWLLDQWNDIRGNAKWTIVLLILGVMMTAAIALTHGLALWQQLTLAVIFLLMFAWALFMTAVMSRGGPTSKTDAVAGSQDQAGEPGQATVLVATTTLPILNAPSDPAIKLTIVAKELQRASPESTWMFKSKLRVVILSEAGKDIEILSPDWIADKSDVPAQRPQGFCSLQLEGPRGWKADDWLSEVGRLHLQHGETFRLWIGLDQSFSESDLKRRDGQQHLGTLVLPVKVNGDYLEFKRRF